MKMIRFLVLALAVSFCANTALAEVGCNQSLVYDASSSGAVKLLSGVSTARTFICGYNIWGAGTTTVKLEYGTGTACATGETALTPAFSVTAQNGPSDSSWAWRGLTAPPGADLCINMGSGVAVQAIIYYTQQ
jgi:hypothetical protein